MFNYPLSIDVLKKIDLNLLAFKHLITKTYE